MPQQLDQLLALIREGQSRVQAEQAQVKEAIAELKEKIEDLQTQPAKKVDLTQALEELHELIDGIEGIYSPPPEVEEQIQEAIAEAEPEEDDEPTVPLNDDTLPGVTSTPEPDVLVSEPDSSIPAEGAPNGVVFDEPA